ncbi:ovochymase-1 isoform X3 [Halyomorpha halys]|uniref:ovochymase-1 isoform X3 n=1 Tax=Halyomorpha halys TaxID=286706 RepID=UPI0006D4F441|nr:transmembrane protease serine 9 isoform X3 [Halyomorpha halys]
MDMLFVITIIVFYGSIAAADQECGTRYAFNNYEAAISYGRRTVRSEFPWHVGLYRHEGLGEKSTVYICGGSILHPKIILTAAHCIYDDTNFRIDNATFFVVAGKYNVSWEWRDPGEQRLKVADIKHPETFVGETNRYADDIALLILNTSIQFNSAIMPVCIDWNAKYEVEKLPPVGTVVGWGLTENNIMNDVLQSANLKFIEFLKCRTDSSAVYSIFITSDKFCAGLDNGTAVQRGDSGGGITSPRKMPSNRVLHYLYGIVSIKEVNRAIAGFTDVRRHIPWLNITLKPLLDSESFKNKLGAKCKSVNFTGICVRKDSCLTNPTTTKLESCNGDLSLICCPPDVTSNRPKRPPGEKAKAMCEIYARTAYIRIESPILLPSSNPTYILPDCPVEELTKGSKNARKNEFPHMVLIVKSVAHTLAVDGTNTSLHFVCSGSIVSPQFILSAAHCYVTKDDGFVLFGTNNKPTMDENISKLFEILVKISKIFLHPHYNALNNNNDIALYKLAIRLNEKERPICLDTGISLFNKTIIGTGFGIKKEEPSNLEKISLNIVNPGLCAEKYKPYREFPEHYVCAHFDGNESCWGDSGGPVQVSHSKHECMYTLIGVTSLSGGCTHHTSLPNVYTKVSDYIGWIEDIVWPDLKISSIAALIG